MKVAHAAISTTTVVIKPTPATRAWNVAPGAVDRVESGAMWVPVPPMSRE
jgi:hypothetical protein